MNYFNSIDFKLTLMAFWEKNKDEIKGPLLILVICISLGYFFYLRNNESIKNGAMTKCEIINILSCFKGSECIEFEYFVNGKKYIGSTDISKIKKPDRQNIKIHSKFDLLYSIKDPGFCTIIIFDKKYSQININGSSIYE